MCMLINIEEDLKGGGEGGKELSAILTQADCPGVGLEIHRG